MLVAKSINSQILKINHTFKAYILYSYYSRAAFIFKRVS